MGDRASLRPSEGLSSPISKSIDSEDRVTVERDTQVKPENRVGTEENTLVSACCFLYRVGWRPI